MCSFCLLKDGSYNILSNEGFEATSALKENPSIVMKRPGKEGRGIINKINYDLKLKENSSDENKFILTPPSINIIKNKINKIFDKIKRTGYCNGQEWK